VSGNWIGSIKINGLQDSINLNLWRGWEDVHGVRFFQRLKGGKTIAIENWFHDPTLKNDKVHCYKNNVLQCSSMLGSTFRVLLTQMWRMKKHLHPKHDKILLFNLCTKQGRAKK
jgi:hypothetical protein